MSSAGPGTPTRPRGAPPSTRLLIWTAILMALFGYGALGFLLAGRREPVESTLPPWLFPALGVAVFVYALIAPRLMGSGDGGRGGAGRDAREGAGSADGRPAGGVDPREIVQWATDEAVAVLGLVSLFLGGTTNAFYLYLLGSFVLLWLHRPRT